MKFRDFLVWMKERGLLADVTEIEVWADDDDGQRELSEEQTDGIIGDPIICFLAPDPQHHTQLLVVEAYDPSDITAGIDYRVWVPITIIALAHRHAVRLICHQPYWGDSGNFAYWLATYDLHVENLAII